MILDVGTGTGRISVPLLERGANLVGCDLSRSMMARLRQKSPPARLAQADAARLPFASGQFDAVLTIHVMHLVGPWRAALGEFRRVLRRREGVYISNWNWHDENAASSRVRGYWRRRVEAHGAEWRRPGIQSREELLEAAKAMGGRIQEVAAARFFSRLAPLEVIEGIAGRLYSDSWELPDEVFEATVRELREWAAQEYGDVTQEHDEERRFYLDVIRFDE